MAPHIFQPFLFMAGALRTSSELGRRSARYILWNDSQRISYNVRLGLSICSTIFYRLWYVPQDSYPGVFLFYWMGFNFTLSPIQPIDIIVKGLRKINIKNFNFRVLLLSPNTELWLFGEVNPLYRSFFW